MGRHSEFILIHVILVVSHRRRHEGRPDSDSISPGWVSRRVRERGDPFGEEKEH